MVGARGALVCLLVWAAEARASQPPRPSADDLRRQFRERAREALEECAARARKDGRFGDVFVRFVRTARTRSFDRFSPRGTGPMGLVVTSTPGLGKRYDACVHRAFAGLAAYGVTDPEDDVEDLWLGTPAPLLPDPARILPVWLAHHRAPGPASAAALRKRLPADVTVTAAGCLQTQGEAIEKGFQLWLERWAQEVPAAWWPLMTPSAGMHLLGDALVTTHFDGGRYRRCLKPLDDRTTRALRASMDALGLCWAGDFADILIHRGVSFPADRRYRAVSVASNRACAVDERGGLICCGEHQPAPPAGTFAEVSVADRHACAITTGGALRCWGREGEPGQAPPAGSYTAVAVSNLRNCALARGGGLACWGNPGAIPAGAFAGGRYRSVSVSEEGVCALDPGGRLSCVKGGGPSQDAGPFAEVHARHPCVLRADHGVWCSDWIDVGRWGLAARASFTTIAVNPTFGCGRRDDGTVDCFGQAPRGSFTPPPGKFVRLAAGLARMCGIREDGAIACWGLITGFNFR